MKRIIAVSAMAVLASLGLSTSAIAGEPTSMQFAAIGTSQGQIDAVVGVCHATQDACGDPSGDVKFILFKRKDGVWVKIASKVTARDQSQPAGAGWSTTFNAPSRGRCKMVAKYFGDATYDPSKTSIKSSCNDNWWIG